MKELRLGQIWKTVRDQDLVRITKVEFDTDSLMTEVEAVYINSGYEISFLLRDPNSYFNDWFTFYSGDSINLKQPCTHEFVNYVGMTEMYDYCTKCDEKRR